MRYQFLTASCVALAISACGAQADEPSDLGVVESPLYSQLGVFWPSSTQIPVCYDAPAIGTLDSYATEMTWARESVAATWEAANPNIRFVGWQPCAEDSKGIRITLARQGYSYSAGVGTMIDGAKRGIFLVFEDVSTPAAIARVDPFYKDCFVAPNTWKACKEWEAAHELGHALGFRHEQERSDTPKACLDHIRATEGLQLTPGPGDAYGAWDGDSIMNYCRPNRAIGGARLSTTDIEAIRLFYPSPAGGVGPGVVGHLDPTGPSIAVNGGWEVGQAWSFEYSTPGVPASARATALTVEEPASPSLGRVILPASSCNAEACIASWTPPTGRPRQVVFRVNGAIVATKTVRANLVVTVSPAKPRVGQKVTITVGAPNVTDLNFKSFPRLSVGIDSAPSVAVYDTSVACKATAKDPTHCVATWTVPRRMSGYTGHVYASANATGADKDFGAGTTDFPIQ